MKIYKRDSQKGFSIIEVAIAGSIMTFMMTAFVSMMAHQKREAKALTEKIAANQTAQFVTNTLENPNRCLQLVVPTNLVSAGQASFNANTVSVVNPHIINLQSIPGTGINTNSEASSLSNSLLVTTIRLLITSPNTATLQLNFDQDNLVRPLKNLELPGINLTLSGPPTNSTISACSLTPMYVLETISIDSPNVATMDDPTWQPAVAVCPTGWSLTGCSYKLVHYVGGTGNSPDRAAPFNGNECRVIAGGLNASAGNQFRAVASCTRIVPSN